MGDGKVNFNQLSFIQKFNYVKNNLSNSTTIKTSDIVNEIVRLSESNKEVSIDDLPEGFKIIKTTTNNVKKNASDNNIPKEVYDSPDIPDLPEDVVKFADTLNKLLENISTLPPEFKNILINVLTEFLNEIFVMNENVQEVYDTPVIPDDVVNENVQEVYDTPNIPDVVVNENVQEVYDTPDIPDDILDVVQEVYDTPDIKENFEKALRGLLPDVTNLSDDVKVALVKLIQSALDKLDQTMTGISTPKASSNNVQTKKTPTEIYHKYGNIVKVYNYSGQLLRTEPYDKATHGTFD